MRSINVGDLVHEVTIQTLTDGVDASGAPLETWTDVSMAWMSRSAESSGESFRGDQLSAAVLTQWVMRWDETMDPDAVDVQKARRLVYQGRIYDIISADAIDRRSGIRLRTLASSRVDA